MTTTLTAAGVTFNDATSQTTTGVEIPAGTLMLFQQSTAPTGWTKQTTHNDKALRVVSGTASSGGTSAFSTVFANQTPTISNTFGIGATTLSTAQMPSHAHSLPSGGTGYAYYNGSSSNSSGGATSGGAGGGGSHTHSLTGTITSNAITLAVQYVDLIIASKN